MIWAYPCVKTEFRKGLIMKKGWFLSILLCFVLAGLVVGCNSNAEATPVAWRDPFRLNVTSEDGYQVTWEGYTEGYDPGVSEPMKLAIQNQSVKPWFGQICISLLEPRPSGVVLPLAEREFTLASGEGFEDTVNFEFPVDLPPGVYGLTLVMQRPAGPMVDVVPIQVGEGGEQRPTDAWPTEVAIEACQ
jgi:hypothetical protein